MLRKGKTAVRVTESYWCPWWPTGGVVPAEVEYIGPWPDGGTGMCVRRFPAELVAESNRLARGFVLALEVAAVTGSTVAEAGEFWRVTTGGVPAHRPEYGDVPGWAVPMGDPRETVAAHD